MLVALPAYLLYYIFSCHDSMCLCHVVTRKGLSVHAFNVVIISECQGLHLSTIFRSNCEDMIYACRSFCVSPLSFVFDKVVKNDSCVLI